MLLLRPLILPISPAAESSHVRNLYVSSSACASWSSLGLASATCTNSKPFQEEHRDVYEGTWLISWTQMKRRGLRGKQLKLVELHLKRKLLDLRYWLPRLDIQSKRKEIVVAFMKNPGSRKCSCEISTSSSWC